VVRGWLISELSSHSGLIHGLDAELRSFKIGPPGSQLNLDLLPNLIFSSFYRTGRVSLLHRSFGVTVAFWWEAHPLRPCQRHAGKCILSDMCCRNFF
jgi:hypothetical protein